MDYLRRIPLMIEQRLDWAERYFPAVLAGDRAV